MLILINFSFFIHIDFSNENKHKLTIYYKGGNIYELTYWDKI